MNVPVGKSTIASWVVVIAGFIAAGLTAWQNAPDWVPMVLAALSYLTLNVSTSTRASQANHLVDSAPQPPNI